MNSLHAIDTFDIHKAPLDGTTLIEASAGTGKTYTLTGLFLRLLVDKALPVDRILVVTFTEAATGELKERIRARLRSTLDALSGRITKDPFAAAFAETVDKGPAIRILRRAVQDFDRAAIFTIHGFCRRVLSEYAFETGVPFDTELLTDTRDLKRSMVEDFWRRRIHAYSPLFVAYALDRGFRPDRLLGLIQTGSSLLKPEVIPRQDIPDSFPGESAYLDAFRRVAESWPESRVAVEEILSRDPALNRNQYKKTAVQGWIRAMHAFAIPGRSDALPFSGLEKFTASQLLRGTRAGHTPPSHPLFDHCDRLMACWEALSASFDRALLGLQAAVFDEVEAGAEQWKAARNAWSFDDLLRHVHAALQGTEGGRLAVALRSRYRAALIDEFQDTDPVQYGIFQKVFGPNDTPLFLIGDPKQAIYGFRGADIFAYLDAARHATRRATLLLNHRSEPGLVQAVNTLYDGHENPFAFQDISFHKVEPAREKGDLPLLQVKRQTRPPLQIWFLEEEETAGRNGKIPKDAGLKRIPEAVARKIRRLLAQGRAGELLLGERPVREGDIAVLLRTNREARIVQKALARWSVPAVLYTGTSLFDTTEAAEMILLLEALARPDREGLFRAAQVTSILGWDGADLQALSSDTGLLENRLLRFRSLHETWKSRGFYSMLRDLLRTEEVLPRLLRMPGGERRATNLLHLAEVLHRAETAQRLGMGGLIQWLAEQSDPRTRETEEEPLRLESDGNAVKLVTIHKSKGLEYPIVFCPFAWHGSGIRSKGPFSFHDPQKGLRLTLDLGSPEPDRREHAALAERENLSENMRIFYVAVTRARNRCYAVWGRFNEAETSAPAYLFHARNMEPEKTPVEASALRFEEKQAPEMRQDLEILAEASGGTIRVSSLETGDADVPAPRRDARPVLSAAAFRARIDRSWTIASFSSLTSSHRHAGDAADYDVPPAPEESRGIMSEAALQGERPGDGFRAFPRGARSGTCLHAVFEAVDFMDTGETVLSGRVRKALLEYGFDPSWETAVCDMIRNVVALPLDPECPGLRLERIPMKDRLNELPFFFPLNRITPRLLGTLMADHGETGSLADLPERIGRLGFAPARGFMRGFVDLVFRYEKRYFLVDWKSNDLGPTWEHYAPERLSRAMVDGLYHVQAFLYTLALDRYLALRLPGYRYDLHFGGAYYIFLRGVDSERGPGSGVHRVWPSTALMEDLRKVLIPETVEPGTKESLL